MKLLIPEWLTKEEVARFCMKSGYDYLAKHLFHTGILLIPDRSLCNQHSSDRLSCRYQEARCTRFELSYPFVLFVLVLFINLIVLYCLGIKLLFNFNFLIFYQFPNCYCLANDIKLIDVP